MVIQIVTGTIMDRIVGIKGEIEVEIHQTMGAHLIGRIQGAQMQIEASSQLSFPEMQNTKKSNEYF